MERCDRSSDKSQAHDIERSDARGSVRATKNWWLALRQCIGWSAIREVSKLKIGMTRDGEHAGGVL